MTSPALTRFRVTAGAASASPDPRRRPSQPYIPTFGPGVPSQVAGWGEKPTANCNSSAAACASTSVAVESSSTSVLELNEFRRGVGLCVMNREGKVFAARWVVPA